jgi:uncharacterized membrane protein
MVSISQKQKERENTLIELYRRKLSSDNVWRKRLQESFIELDRVNLIDSMNQCNMADEALLDFIYRRAR